MDAEHPHLLIVTGPLRDHLYERFARLYANASDVRVIKDRRYGERRRSERPRDDDRRRSDRRSRPPEWVFPPESV
ncbi:MAG: hypothetical protein FJ000_07985 [Actinobacteria bacterium]|nr:hypothetical protein [Actinomycetota bacterium]